MAATIPALSAARQHATLAKVTRRIVPFIFLLYTVCFLDRVNVGFAALQMNRALGFGPAVYGFGAGIFFLGYALFEVPSNLILARVGARVWIARIMLTWGVLAAAMMFVRGPLSFYGLRLLLGVAEAGFFPGIVYYLTCWFPAEQRARAIARFMVAAPLSYVLGGPISGALLGLSGRLGLAGWQWLFLIEGLPAAALGMVVLVYLTDRPENAKWLESDERAWLSARIAAERTDCERQHGYTVRQALSNRVVWQLGVIEFTCITLGGYVLNLWLPQIIKGFGGVSDAAVGLISAIPFVTAGAFMLWVGSHSDRTGERFFHIVGCTTLAAVGLLLCACTRTPIYIMFGLSLAAAGQIACHGPLWSLPTRFLTGSAAAGAIALINSIANLSGFVGPYAIGLLKGASGNFRSGFLLLALVQFAGAALVLRARRAPVLATWRPLSAAPAVPLAAHGP